MELHDSSSFATFKTKKTSSISVNWPTIPVILLEENIRDALGVIYKHSWVWQILIVNQAEIVGWNLLSALEAIWTSNYLLAVLELIVGISWFGAKVSLVFTLCGVSKEVIHSWHHETIVSSAHRWLWIYAFGWLPFTVWNYAIVTVFESAAFLIVESEFDIWINVFSIKDCQSRRLAPHRGCRGSAWEW